MTAHEKSLPTHTESHYIHLACAAVSRGDDDLAARYLEFAEEARRRAALRAAVLRAFLDAQHEN